MVCAKTLAKRKGKLHATQAMAPYVTLVPSQPLGASTRPGGTDEAGVWQGRGVSICLSRSRLAHVSLFKYVGGLRRMVATDATDRQGQEDQEEEGGQNMSKMYMYVCVVMWVIRL